MSTSGRRIDLTAEGGEGYFYTRSNPHASPPTRSTFLPFSSQSPAKRSSSSTSEIDAGIHMSHRLPSMVGQPVVDPIFRPGNSLSKAFELVDDIEDISATQWEAEASKSSRTGSSQSGAGGSSRRARYSSPDMSHTAAGPSRSVRTARKTDRGGGREPGNGQSSSPMSGSSRRKRKRGSVSIMDMDALPNTSPVPRLEQPQPGSSSATSYAHPKTPNVAPSDVAYDWSPSPTPVPRRTKEAARLEDLFSSPTKPEGELNTGNEEVYPDDVVDFDGVDLDDTHAAPPRLPAANVGVPPKPHSDPASRPRPIIFDDEPPPVSAEDEIYDEMEMPDSFDEYDLPLNTDLADIDLLDIPALVAGSAGGSGSVSVSSQSKNVGSDTGTPVGRRPAAIPSDLHRALFGADDGGARPASRLPKDGGGQGTPRSGNDAASSHVNKAIGDDLGFSRISELPPKWQDFYLHHWRRGVDGRKAPRVSRDSLDDRLMAATAGPSRATRGKTKATAPRARERLVEESHEEDEGDGEVINFDDDEDDKGDSDADTYRDGSQDSFVDDEGDPAAQRAREKKRQAKFNEALSGTRKRGAARPGRGARGNTVSSAARSLAANGGLATGLGPQEPKGRAAGGKRGAWGGKRGFRGGRGGWRGAARGRR